VRGNDDWRTKLGRGRNDESDIIESNCSSVIPTDLES
jgi:hypothetical protein